MHGQYEQQCNAHALKQMGVPVIKKLSHKKAIESFENWLCNDTVVAVDYENQTDQVVDLLMARHAPKSRIPQLAFPAGYQF